MNNYTASPDYWFRHKGNVILGLSVKGIKEIIQEHITTVVIPNEIDGIKINKLDQDMTCCFSEATPNVTHLVVPFHLVVQVLSIFPKRDFPRSNTINSLTVIGSDHSESKWYSYLNKNLKEINVLDNDMYFSEEGVLYSTDHVLLFYPKAKEEKHFNIKPGTEFIRGFNDNPYLETVTIPNSVTKIEQIAFAGSSITEIALPAHVEIIEKYAFSKCKQLRSITLNEGLRIIRTEAFVEYKGEDIHLPYTVTMVEENAFTNSTAKVFDADGKDITALLKKPGNHHIVPATEKKAAVITLPDIDHAYMDGKEVDIAGLTNIIIQGNMEIPENAFANNRYLKKVVISDEVTGIGKRAFERCSELLSIQLGKGITNISEEAFQMCPNLKEVCLPDSVKAIEGYAFAYCNQLTSIDLSAGIESIGAYAFSGCRLLEQISCTSQIKHVGYHAFDGIPWFEKYEKEFLVLGGCLVKHTYKNYKEDPNITIPNTVTAIAYDVLGLKTVTALTIPGSVKSIETGTFKNANIENVIMLDGVEELGDTLFNTKSLKSSVLPESIRKISISSVPVQLLANRKDECFYIGKVFFKYNGRKTKIDIQPGTVSIGAQAFHGKHTVKSITLPEGLTHIYEQAFSECENLGVVGIPGSVEYIAPDAFEKCDSVVLRCIDGSYGLEYAKEHRLPYAVEV